MEKDVFAAMLNEDDKQTKAIKDMEEPEEVKAALELLGEKIDETPKGDTPSKPTEPDEFPKEEEKDTSKVTEKTEAEKKIEVEKKLNGEEPPKLPDDETKFLLTDEVIEKQPEENKAILAKYKGQGKEELAQAAANAVALKTPHFKDNPKAIALFKEQFLEKTDDELINILVDTQRETGRVEKPAEEKKSIPKIELPSLPDDDPEIQKILDKETLVRLKAKYPNLPAVENMDAEEYKEWRRDLNTDEPDNKFKEDLQQTREAVKTELSKVVYIKNNLPNLFEESPNEVLPLLTEANLPRLKALNDNPMSVLEQDLQTEIEIIKNGLKKFGLTEQDIIVDGKPLDLTVTKDETGTPFNKTLNDLIMEGKTADGTPIPSGKIIGTRGKTFWLKQGELARKFKEEFDDKILTAFVNKKTQTEKVVKEKIKDETLLEASGKGGGGGKKVLTVEDIQKEQDPVKMQKILADLEKN